MPPDADTLLSAGRRAHESGDLATAIDAYQAALAARPKDPKTLYFLGNVLMEAGQAGQALPHLEAAAAVQRNHPAVIGSLAEVYFQLGRYSEAENLFRKASRSEPRAAFLQIGLANALAMQKKFADAETLLKRLLSRDPDITQAWLNLGNVARDQSRLEEAAAHYREALRRDPRLADAYNNLGSVLHASLRFEQAEQAFRHCLAIDPHAPLARSNLASVLIDLGRFRDAEAVSRELVADAPDVADAHAMLASALGQQGRLAEALPHHREAARIAPQTARYVTTYATALCELGDADTGLREFGPILRTESGVAAIAQLVTPVLLANGFFAEGWRRHTQRQSFLQIQPLLTRLNLQQSLPAELHNKHVGVLCEQGLGDELFFLRFVPQLKARGARITYCTSPKLGSILRRTAAIDDVITDVKQFPATDWNIVVGDLAHAFCASASTPLATLASAGENTLLAVFPWTYAPYAPLPPPSLSIAPLPDALDALRARLAAAGPPPYLGITWRGGTAPDQQRGADWKLFKEVPIPQLAQALRAWPGTLIALQRLPVGGELDALQSALGRPVADFTAVNEDLEHMLALLSLIDEYVGVSNTNVHLRALVNRPTRVLVPCPAEWRWMAAGASPWFRGSGVYRQTPDSRWDDALDALRRDLIQA